MFEQLNRRLSAHYGIVVSLVDSALQMSSIGRLGGLFKFHSDIGISPELEHVLDTVANKACLDSPNIGLERYRAVAILLLFMNKQSSKH